MSAIVLKALGLGYCGLQMKQSHDIFKAQAATSEAIHLEEISLATKQHRRDLLMLKQTHLMDVCVNLKKHCQQLNSGTLALFNFSFIFYLFQF